MLPAKPFDDFEGKEERCASIEVRSIPASNLEDRRVDPWSRARNHPAFIADANRLAGNERVSSHASTGAGTVPG